MKHMLVVMAHPDDESMFTGGTIAKYADAGWQVDILMATRGEAGDRGPLVQLGRDKVGETRQKELEAAATKLGVHAITFMGYKDGTLKDRTPGDIEDPIHKKMMEFIPDIVLTMDTTGITHHPDHIKICYATTYAFQKYAAWIEKSLKSREEEEQIFPKLYYACFPESIVGFAVKKHLFPPEQYGLPFTGVPDKSVTTLIDITDFAETKKSAIRCHITQRDHMEKYMNIPGDPLLTKEYFIFRMHGTTEVFMGKNDHVADYL